MSLSRETGNNERELNRRDVLRGIGTVGATATLGTAAAGSETQGKNGDCVSSDWPDPIGARIDLHDDEPVESGDMPDSGDIVIFVHGWLADDVFGSIHTNGTTMAHGLHQALEEEGFSGNTIAAMWDSLTLWSTAKRRADRDGKTLATWLDNNAWRYDSVTLVAHSLGSRVSLVALQEVTRGTVDSVALLGGAVHPDTVCDEYKDGIEDAVEDKVYNYHTEADGTVCNTYAIREGGPAIGCEGSDCDAGFFSERPTNFEDVDMTGKTYGHCGYLKPTSMDFEGRSCAPEIVDKQFDGGDGDGGNGGGGGDDDGGSGGGGWCFITTATAKESHTLNSLRRFRDESMAATPLGRGLVWLYYRISPPIAETLERHPESRTTRVVRSLVKRCAGLSDAQEETNSRVKSAFLGTMLTMLYVVGILVAACGHAAIRATE